MTGEEPWAGQVLPDNSQCGHQTDQSEAGRFWEYGSGVRWSEFQKALGEKPDGDLADVKFISDPKIGRAECLLESPKGIVESLINEHLDRISKALKKAE